MRKVFCFLTVLFLFISLQAQESYEIIDTLASSAFAGRGYVDDGMRKAAGYIRDEFERIHLTPVFDKGYLQEFSHPVNTFPGEMKVMADGVNLKPGIDFITDPASKGLRGTFTTETIKNTELLNVSLLNRKIKNSSGKILVIDNRNRSRLDEKLKKTNEDIIRILKYDPELKMAGVIELTDEKIPWGVSQEEAPRFILQLRNDTISRINEVSLSVENKFIKNFKAVNVSGYVKGKVYPDSFLVLTAHYDHLGKMGEKLYFSGANDNASGVAMMLTLARYFQENPSRYSVLFIAFASEEAGLLGSAYFTEHPPVDLKKIKFLINFDLAGTGEEGITVVNGQVFDEKFELLKKINSENHLLARVKDRGEACISDHCFFYRAGVPCFYIYTMGGSPAYHDTDDIPQNLSLAGFKEYTSLMIKFLESF